VESCTAVVEHYDGTFELVRWADILQARRQKPAAVAVPARAAAVA
jgi:hypothetical protein